MKANLSTILFGDNNGHRLNITKAISKCLGISLIEANKYTKSGGIILPENMCKDLVGLLDSYSIKYSICDEIKRVFTKPVCDEIVQELPKEKGMSIVESGICKVGSVYILTQEAFDKLAKYKHVLTKLSLILSELNISNNE